MPSDATLTLDDLDAIAHRAAGLDDPSPVVAELVAAVEQGRLAEPADAAHAFLLASEITERAGDLPAALGLAERAAAAPGADGFVRAGHAELLVRSGHAEQGRAVFADVRPELLQDPLAASYLSESLEAAGLAGVAEEWLSAAVRTLLSGDQPVLDRVEVMFALVKERHRVREGLGLEHDELDDLYHEMQVAVDTPDPDEGRALLFWPEAELAALLARWPGQAETYGSDWDEHRAGLERTLAGWSGSGVVRLGLFVGSVDGLLAFAAEEGVDPADPQAHLEYADVVGETAGAVEWPPQRNAPCWCGSGVKYKKCCLPRSRG
ncbi:SEC-C domain-containing protein [Actinoplanes teichomyceticus]|uniref:SEC-C motif-containing protein n=1 Tax=Actinoplanes teichomyceticus TaxID=1867 RepID=A0A561VGD8_ACTTI|nr:SEC-C domain-containing protein [Actinoplanes teichomyceticus]TWG10673.1 SEC-C motif-containing protein [Actinoplanes teichomyceticus]GIF15442.1 preprotein translocase SecA [Actinoplanes teichomyceticus]